MNIKQTLEKCKTLWETIAEHNLSSKYEAYQKLGWASTDIFLCPACEFTLSSPSSDSVDCTKCPISVWRASDDFDSFACEKLDGPYHRWFSTPDWADDARVRAEEASRAMVDLIERELSLLEG